VCFSTPFEKDGVLKHTLHFMTKMQKRWMLAAEVALVLVIVALLVATWLPAIIGARGSSGR